VTYLVYGLLFFVLAVVEWVRWLRPPAPLPIPFTVVALCAITYSAYKIIRVRRAIRNLELGRDGERAVAEILDGLRKEGYAVLHDIVAGDFNVDHVVLSPRGIYAIETKTLRKPPTGEISFSGDGLIAGHFNLGSRPIRQAIAQAKWLQELLAESTGKKFCVRPVLLFPGWFVHPMPQDFRESLWVLNPKALPSFIANEPIVLNGPDMHLATFHLASHVRSRG
jgi:hypothetical protein